MPKGDTALNAPTPIWVAALFGVLFAAGIITIGVVMAVWNGQNVKFIADTSPTAVGPDGTGTITLIAGLGELIVADAPNHDLTVSNTGVVFVNGLSPDAGGNLVIDVTVPGLSVASAGNTVTLANTGVLSATADIGISVTPAATGDIVVKNTGVITGNGLNPDVAGNMVWAAGQGLSVASAGSTITYANTGLITANGLSPNGAGNMVFAAGAGMGVTSAGNTITYDNTGVLTLNNLVPIAGNVIVTATDGLSAAAAGNTVTITDVLTTQTLLDNTNALGPLVDYTAFIGFFVPVPENTWRTGLTVGFPNAFVPGSFDDGQGNVFGAFWTVPAVGTYTINTDCEVVTNAIAVNDYQSVTAALCLGANSEDPLAAGIIPNGAYQTLILSGGTNANLAAPSLDPRLSFSTTFQAGCTNCLVQVGQTLSLHTRMDRTGAVVPPGTYTADFVCRLQVARVK